MSKTKQGYQHDWRPANGSLSDIGTTRHLVCTRCGLQKLWFDADELAKLPNRQAARSVMYFIEANGLVWPNRRMPYVPQCVMV